MTLRVTHTRADGAWKQTMVYLDDGPLTFFLDPNQPRTLRFKPNEESYGGQWPSPWVEVDLDRMEMIARLLVEATTDTGRAA